MCFGFPQAEISLARANSGEWVVVNVMCSDGFLLIRDIETEMV
jgi:hypothetical protein